MISVTAVLIFLGTIEVVLALHSSDVILLLLYLEDEIGHVGPSEVLVVLHENFQLLLPFGSFVQILVEEIGGQFDGVSISR